MSFHTISESAEFLSNGPKVLIVQNRWVLQNLLFHIYNQIFHLQKTHTETRLARTLKEEQRPTNWVPIDPSATSHPETQGIISTAGGRPVTVGGGR